MLSDALIEQILESLPRYTIGVIGDLFLDRYLDIDPTWNEPSLETGLTAYQVVRVRSYPGAAGTLINNLAALGVGRIVVLSMIGDDGEGYELRQALAQLMCVDTSALLITPQRRTPTYTKPMLAGQELNRLDIKNRSPTPQLLQDRLLTHLEHYWPQLDALLILDQVSEADCGVITARVREQIIEYTRRQPSKYVLADSRERIGLFRQVMLKPNERECRQAAQLPPEASLADCVQHLAAQCGSMVFCTRGPEGILLADGKHPTGGCRQIPAYPVAGPIDPVGAGDSCSAGIIAALLAGATAEQAAAFGNLIASITITQLGVTGTANPQQVRQRWQAVRSYANP
jgi:rfaE bifunctional protein kinase chain/domain